MSETIHQLVFKFLWVCKGKKRLVVRLGLDVYRMLTPMFFPVESNGSCRNVSWPAPPAVKEGLHALSVVLSALIRPRVRRWMNLTLDELFSENVCMACPSRRWCICCEMSDMQNDQKVYISLIFCKNNNAINTKHVGVIKRSAAQNDGNKSTTTRHASKAFTKIVKICKYKYKYKKMYIC